MFDMLRLWPFINPRCEAKVLVGVIDDDNPLELTFSIPSCDVRVELILLKVLLVDVISEHNPFAFVLINPNCDVRVELMLVIFAVWPFIKLKL